MGLILWLLMLINIFCATIAQLFFKFGMNSIGHFEFTTGSFMPIVVRVILSPWIVLGLFSYVIGLAVWLMVLSRAEVSVAYPITSLGYILSAIAGYYLFNENLTLTRIIGIVVIMFGVYLVSRN